MGGERHVSCYAKTMQIAGRMGYRTPSVAGSMGDERGPMGDEMCLEYCKTMQIAGSTGGERCLEYGKTVQIAGSMGGERCLEYGKTLQIAAFAQEGALSASRCCSCLGMKKTCLQRPHFQLSTPNKKKFGFLLEMQEGLSGGDTVRTWVLSSSLVKQCNLRAKAART